MRFSRAFSPVRSISAAWRAMKVAPGPMIVGGILMAITTGGGGGGGNLGSIAEDGGSLGGRDVALLLGIVAFVLVLAVAFWLFGCLIRVGFAGATESVLATGNARVGQVFEHRGLWGKMLLTTLLRAALSLAASLPLILVGVVIGLIAASAEGSGPSGVAIAVALLLVLLYLPVMVYVSLGLSLMPEACALEGLGAGDSMRRSWSLVAGHRLDLLVYYVVLGLFSLSGLLACCIGVLFTSGLTNLAYYESYLRLVRSEEDQKQWSLRPG